MAQSPSSELLTEQEVAGLLRVRGATLQSWRSRQLYDLPFLKIGRLVRYRRQDVFDYMERQTRASHTEDEGDGE